MGKSPDRQGRLMDVKLDRREILSMMREHFPLLHKDISSDDLHGFLDAQTGLETPFDMPNASAFDRWRQALAGQGYQTWGYSESRAAEVKARGEELKDLEIARVKALPDVLKALAKEAPGAAMKNP